MSFLLIFAHMRKNERKSARKRHDRINFRANMIVEVSHAHPNERSRAATDNRPAAPTTSLATKWLTEQASCYEVVTRGRHTIFIQLFLHKSLNYVLDKRRDLCGLNCCLVIIQYDEFMEARTPWCTVQLIQQGDLKKMVQTVSFAATMVAGVYERLKG